MAHAERIAKFYTGHGPTSMGKGHDDLHAGRMTERSEQLRSPAIGLRPLV